MIHRFFLPPSAWQNESVHFDAASSHQIAHVLRMRPGAQVIVFDNSGLEYQVELSEVHGKSVTGRILARRRVDTEPRISLTLYAAVLKGEKFEWVLQKGTEVGVGCFVPLLGERTVARDPAQIESKRARWERIIQEATEQSGRVRLPTLARPTPFAAALAHSVAQNDLTLFLSPEPSASPLTGLSSDIRPLRVGLFIGPEGGFSDSELAQAQAAGLRPFSLGPRILRAETAAVVAAALTLFVLDKSTG